MYVNYWTKSSVTRTFTSPQNWVIPGVEALTLYFRGTAGNALAPELSVTLIKGSGGAPKSATVAYDGDVNDLLVEEWHEWNIALQDFLDIEPDLPLTAIGDIVIDFGQNFTGTDGVIHVDDIRLYGPKCVPSKALFDITGDCIVDYQDMGIMTRDWLDTDYEVAASAPDPGPIASYQFEEGAGDTITNSGSLGGDANGTIYADANRPTWVTDDPCALHAKCMEFDGIDDFVGIPDFNSIALPFTTDTLTITAWVKRNGVQEELAGIMYATRNANDDWDDSVCHAGLSLGAEWADRVDALLYHWDGDVGWWWAKAQDFTVPDGVWTFCAVVVEPEQATLYMKAGGQTIMTETNYETHIESTFDHRWTIGMDERDWEAPRNFKGRIDDIRIYDYALSIDKILYVAGLPGTVYIPLVSPANLNPKVGDEGVYNANNIDTIDFKDYAILINHWLEEIVWP